MDVVLPLNVLPGHSAQVYEYGMVVDGVADAVDDDTLPCCLVLGPSSLPLPIESSVSVADDTSVRNVPAGHIGTGLLGMHIVSSLVVLSAPSPNNPWVVNKRWPGFAHFIRFEAQIRLVVMSAFLNSPEVQPVHVL